MKDGQKIYVIDFTDIPYGKSCDDLTDKEWIEISNGWYFNSWEEFLDTFNNYPSKCPVSDTHCLRVI